jgi:hypothetical protein
MVIGIQSGRWELSPLARIFHESLAATTDMAVLPGVLGCRRLRRTVQVRLGTNTLRLPGGTPILFALAALRSVPQAGSQFRDLATAIHEISGLGTIPFGISPLSLDNLSMSALC